MNYTRGRPSLFSLGLIIIDGLFFGLTNPNNIASVLLIVGFALILLTLCWLLYNLQKVASLYIPWVASQKYLSLSAALVVALLLALQSVGQLTPRDALLVTIASIILYAYLGYSQKTALTRS